MNQYIRAVHPLPLKSESGMGFKDIDNLRARGEGTMTLVEVVSSH